MTIDIPAKTTAPQGALFPWVCSEGSADIPWPLIHHTAPSPPGLAIAAPVDRVMLMEDRAQVTRSATLALSQGVHTVVIPDVTPLLVDRTLAARTMGCRLVDVRQERFWVLKWERPGEEIALRERIILERRAYLALHDRLQALLARRDRQRGLSTATMELIAREAGLGRSHPERWEELLGLQEDGTQSLEAAIHDLRWDIDTKRRVLEAMRDRLIRLLRPTSALAARIVTTVACSDEEARIEWEYLVPSAVWRPEHEASLEGEHVHFTTLASVWQNTGEDWGDVELTLSTARPSLGAMLPLLEEDRLTLRPKSAEERRTVKVESRDQQVDVTTSARDVAQAQEVLAADDGGEARVFRVPDRVTIPSDGRPHQVSLARWSWAAKVGLWSVPELAEHVFLRAELINQDQRPLLAGPVAIVRQGGFFGRSVVTFVASGEPFALSLGSDDQIQVVRRTRRQHREMGLSRRHRHEIVTEIYLSNLGTEPQEVRVQERVPVSELEDVEVRVLDQTSEGFALGDDGVGAWTVSLAPGERSKLTLAVRVEMPSRVVWES